MLVRITDRRPHLIGVVLFGERTGGTVDDTLTAGNAGRFHQIAAKGAANLGNKAALIAADDAHALILAGCDTAAAEYALGVIPHQMNGRILDLRLHIRRPEANLIHAEFLCQCLQLTGSASVAGKALHPVVGENQLQRHLPCLAHFFCVGEHFHALIHGIYTGSDQSLCTLDLYHADTAGANLI